MQNKSNKGGYTVLVISIIVALTILLIFWLTTTDIFTLDKDLLIKEAGKVTSSSFKRECKTYNINDVMENNKELKGVACAYRGTVEELSSDTFGGYTAYVKVKVSEDSESKIDKNKFIKTDTNKSGENNYYYYLKVQIDDKESISAAVKDLVDVYGYMGKITEYNGITTLEVEGEIVEAVEK